MSRRTFRGSCVLLIYSARSKLKSRISCGKQFFLIEMLLYVDSHSGRTILFNRLLDVANVIRRSHDKGFKRRCWYFHGGILYNALENPPCKNKNCVPFPPTCHIIQRRGLVLLFFYQKLNDIMKIYNFFKVVINNLLETAYSDYFTFGIR
jgi:hypothetical protein